MSSPDKKRTPPRGSAGNVADQQLTHPTAAATAISPDTNTKENPTPTTTTGKGGKGASGLKQQRQQQVVIDDDDDDDDNDNGSLGQHRCQQQNSNADAATATATTTAKVSPKSSGSSVASKNAAATATALQQTSTGAGGKKFVQQTISFGVSREPFLLKQIEEKDGAIRELEHRSAVAEGELARLRRVQADMADATGGQVARMARYQEAMSEVMRESARTARREARRALANKSFELGHQTVIATPMGNKEVWVQGNLMRNLMGELEQIQQQMQQLETRKATVEKQKKTLARQADRERDKVEKERKKKVVSHQQQHCDDDDDDNSIGGGMDHAAAAAAVNNSAADCSNPGIVPDTALLDAEEELENVKQELARLKSLEASRKQQADDGFASEKIAFLKERSRIQYEDQSDFASVPAIGECGRYVLMYLLGKGGFSEVWRAFDLHEGRHVACKIHRIRREWAPAVKEQYMRHARRELDIQRSLDHPRLTKLYDVFECNASGEIPSKDGAASAAASGGNGNAGANSDGLFVSVMEFCAGEDLDTHLKRCRTLPEQHARVVFMQMVAGLRHMAEQKEPIIHFDLKPANIVYVSNLSTCLDIKITDFGLSKIIAEGAHDGDGHIEQTSPGAGTYWYLPPECFTQDGNSQLISAKVDIWAAGVIFYQMLYGRRPFAHEESQRRIWNERLISTQAAKPVEFPDKPVVSQAAKDLIRRCLTFNTLERPDIFALSADPYLRQSSRRRARAATPAGTHLAGPATPANAAGMEFLVPAPPGKK